MERYKKIKFFIDVGVGRKVEKWLLNNGYDTKNVRDIDPRMIDKHILCSYRKTNGYHNG